MAKNVLGWRDNDYCCSTSRAVARDPALLLLFSPLIANRFLSVERVILGEDAPEINRPAVCDVAEGGRKNKRKKCKISVC